MTEKDNFTSLKQTERELTRDPRVTTPQHLTLTEKETLSWSHGLLQKHQDSLNEVDPPLINSSPFLPPQCSQTKTMQSSSHRSLSAPAQTGAVVLTPKPNGPNEHTWTPPQRYRRWTETTKGPGIHPTSFQHCLLSKPRVCGSKIWFPNNISTFKLKCFRGETIHRDRRDFNKNIWLDQHLLLFNRVAFWNVLL